MHSFFQNAKEHLKNLVIGIVGVAAIAAIVVSIFWGLDYLANLYDTSVSMKAKMLTSVGMSGAILSVLAIWGIAAFGGKIRNDFAKIRAARRPLVR